MSNVSKLLQYFSAAISYSMSFLLQILLDNGFDVWTVNSKNQSAMGLALESGHLSVYKHLLLYQTCQCLLTEATKHKMTNLR